MMRLACTAAAFALVLFAPMAASAQISAGQVWTFKDAPTDKARLAIQRIEPLDGREVAHVSIYNLPAVGMFRGEVSHMAFERSALEASLDQLSTDKAPDETRFLEGYRAWLVGSRGVSGIPVSEAIAYVIGIAERATPIHGRYPQ